MSYCRHQRQECGRYPEAEWIIYWCRCPDCGASQYERRAATDPYYGRPALPSVNLLQR